MLPASNHCTQSPAARAGVEMELPLVVRNTEIGCNATASFYAYLNASAAYGWTSGALKSYYNGNDFSAMAQNNVTLYNALCAFVAAT